VPAPAEVGILGAGIAGCALAYHLVDRGAGPVVVVDPKTPGAGATGRAAGIVTEQLWNRWDVEVTRESKAQYAALAARWDPSAYTVNGFVRWATGADAIGVLSAAVGRLRAWGVTVEELDPDELAARVPWGRFDDRPKAVWSPTDAVVTPSTMGELFAEGARQKGVEFRLGSPIDRVRYESASWCVESAGSTTRSRRLVVAAGAWSKRLLASIGHPLPLAPYRTQAAVLRPASGPAVFPSVHDIDVDVYARPEANGRILAGDGTQLVEVDPETFRTGADDSFVQNLAETFAQRLPGWANAELVRAWAGVCTSTPDRRPFVGPIPDSDGVYVITGFNGFGVMRAGGVAARLADLLASGDGSDRALERLGPALPSRLPPNSPPFTPRPGFTLDDGDDPRF
jgi:sarcosine oxidase, subunit beta